MATLDDIFSMDDFIAMREQGYIRVQVLDDSVLAIANYTEKAQYERNWNDVTKSCRGLIFDVFTREVVARPFAKFPNWDESGWPYPPTGPVIRMPKFDGSLGILYDYNDQEWIATRGSFTSEQAVHGTRIYREMRESTDPKRKPGVTYLFEIVYPSNRIVVDYGDLEALVLLDVIDNETGHADLEEFDAFDWPLKTERVALPSFDFGQVSDIPEGEEGFVFLWPARNRRVKLKSAEYVHLHRIVTGLNERTVWELLGHGRSVQEICEPLPDELHAWVGSVARDLKTQATAISTKAYQDFAGVVEALPEGYSRGEFARYISMLDNRAYLFSILDGKDFSDAVWKTLKPAANRGPRAVDETVA